MRKAWMGAVLAVALSGCQKEDHSGFSENTTEQESAIGTLSIFKSALYTLNQSGWQHNGTPSGDVFTCSVCEGQVQLQIDVGHPIKFTAQSPFKNNEGFMRFLQSEKAQKVFSESYLKDQIPLNSGVKIKIDRTGITSVGGQKAFEYEASVTIDSTATHDNTLLLLYKGRMVKITLNYYIGTFNQKTEKAVKAIFSSIKFV